MLSCIILWFFTAANPVSNAPNPTDAFPCLSGIINEYTPVLGFGCDSSTLQVGSSSGFTAGAKVLLIQMQVPQVDLSNTASFGNLLNTSCIGNYEFNRVESVAGNTVQLKFSLLRPYDLGGKVQLVLVPEYDSAMVCGITCLPWNGSVGGVLALDVKTDLALLGAVDVSGKGFRGGVVEPNDVPWVFGEKQYFYAPQSTLAAQKGEGFVMIPVDFSYGRGRAGNGGGGGNAHNGGGGGGANAGSGGSGGFELIDFPAPPNPNTEGIEGLKYFENRTDKILLGGGGGAGHANDKLGTPGGNGGGIVFLSANTLTTNNFRVLANGADILGGTERNDGQGGGGGGGTVLLQVNQINGTLDCELKGGRGGSNPYSQGFQLHGPGGGGGGGKLLLAQGVANVIPALQGGINGLSTQNMPHGAKPGEPGVLLAGFNVPESFAPAHPVSNQMLLSAASPTCAGLVDGQISILHSTALAFRLNGGPWQPDSVFSNLAPGTYQIGLQFSGGCTLDTSVVLNVPIPVLDSLVQLSPAGCSSGGIISVDAVSGIAPFEFQANGGAWQPNGTFVGLSAGTYTISVRDALGCIHSEDYTVNGTPPALDTLLSLEDATCVHGGLIAVDAVSGLAPFEFQLNNGPWQPSGLFQDLPAGAYTLTLRDAAGCVQVQDYTIGDAPPAQFSLLALMDATCVDGGEITVGAISGTMPFEFQIDGGSWQPNGLFLNLPAGNHNIVMRDAAGCTQTQDYVIGHTPPAQFSLLSLEDATCITEGAITVGAIAGTMPFEFQINGGNWQPNGQFQNLPAGNYSIVMRDFAGCTQTQDYVISPPLPAQFSLISLTEATCATGGEITVEAVSGTAPYEFQINGGLWQPTGQFQNLPAGNYSIALRDAAGCTQTQDYVIAPPPPAQFSLFSLEDATCATGGEITVEAVSGTAPYEFQVNGSPWQPTGQFQNLPAGNYSIALRDAAGCTQTQDYVITPPPPAQFSLFSLEDATCATGGTITVEAASGTAPYEFQVNGGLWQPTGQFQNLPAGNYSVALRDAAGCTQTQDYVIAPPPPAQFSLLSLEDATCTTGGAITVEAVSGTMPFAFQINGGNWQPMGHFQGLPAGNYSIGLQDAAGCADTAQYQIAPPPILMDTLLSLAHKTCHHSGSIALSAVSGTPPFEYQINGSIWQPSGLFTDLSAGIYNIVLRDGADCIQQETYLIEEDAPLLLRLDSLGHVDCRHPFGFVAVTASGGTGGYTFHMSPEPVDQGQSGYFNELVSGIYSVAVTDSSGCMEVLQGVLLENRVDSVQTQEKVTIYEGSFYRLPDGKQTSTPGQYPFHYQTLEGCDSLHLIDLEVLRRHIYIPNVFQPSGEGVNDFFTVYADESLEMVEELSVFDRWGEWLFLKENLLPNDEENGWDGSFRGKAVSPGVYVWKAKLKFKDGLEWVLHGNVTIVR